MIGIIAARRKESPSGTDVTTVGPTINASPTPGSPGSGNILAITAGGQISLNGSVLGGANVIEEYYTGHTAYQQNASLQWFGPITASGTGTSVANPKPPVAGAMSSKSFGMHAVQGDQIPTYATTDNMPMGAARVWDTRQGALDWNNIETSGTVGSGGTTHNWATFDTVINSWANAGLDIVWCTGYPPAWETAATTNAPANNADYTEFVSAVYTRAAGRIKFWEVWNEANDLSNFFHNGTLTQLVDLASRMSAIVSQNPALVRLTPDCTYPAYGANSGVEFMVQFLKMGGAQYADGGACHIYPHEVSDPASGINGVGLAEQIWQQAHLWIAGFDAGGLAGKPVYVTEGSNLSPNWVIQSANITLWAAMWHMLILSAGAEAAYFYGWDYSNTLPIASGTTLNSNGVACKTVMNWLNGCTWVNRVARVYGTNGISNPTGSGLGASGTQTAPTGWSVTGAASNVTYSFLGTGTQNGMSYLVWRIFTTATSTGSGNMRLFFSPAVSTTTSQWWFIECFLALDPASSMTNGVPNGIGHTQIIMQDNNGATVNCHGAGFSTLNNCCLPFASSINVSKKIFWGITAASAVTTVRPFINVPFNSGATIDVRFRVGLGATPDVGGPTLDQATTWSADINNATTGKQGRIRWDMSGGNPTYTPPAPYNVKIANIAGTVSNQSGAVTLTNQPQLLSNI